MSTTVARANTFTDIDLGFRSNPVTGDIAKKKDIEAIKQSCLNILLTDRGEKPFDPSFGSSITGQLFENFDPVLRESLKEEVELALRLREPRIKVLSVDVVDLSERNALEFRVEVQIQSPEATITEINFIVERQR
jgi:phage baseplate assembly protein W